MSQTLSVLILSQAQLFKCILADILVEVGTSGGTALSVLFLLSPLQGSLQIYLKSRNGPIEVYLCPEEGLEDGSPVKSLISPKKESPQSPQSLKAPAAAPAAPQSFSVKEEPVEGKLELVHGLIFIRAPRMCSKIISALLWLSGIDLFHTNVSLDNTTVQGITGQGMGPIDGHVQEKKGGLYYLSYLFCLLTQFKNRCKV